MCSRSLRRELLMEQTPFQSIKSLKQLVQVIGPFVVCVWCFSDFLITWCAGLRLDRVRGTQEARDSTRLHADASQSYPLVLAAQPKYTISPPPSHSHTVVIVLVLVLLGLVAHARPP